MEKMRMDKERSKDTQVFKLLFSKNQRPAA